jgi:hypothetical protein
MTIVKTPLEVAAGKLISSIQKEWNEELGEPGAAESEAVMDKAHDILAASKDGSLPSLLHGLSVSGFLGVPWVKQHPSIAPAILTFETEMKSKTKGSALESKTKGSALEKGKI